MSKIMVPQYVDDLTGARLGEDGTTISFAFQGHAYEIDLSPDNAKKMTNALGMYIDHARRAEAHGRGRRRGTGGSSSGASDETKAARAWLVEQGILSETSRGRISAENMEKYRSRGQMQMESASKTDTDSSASKPKAEAKPATNGTTKASDGNSSAPAKKAPKVSGVASLMP